MRNHLVFNFCLWFLLLSGFSCLGKEELSEIVIQSQHPRLVNIDEVKTKASYQSVLMAAESKAEELMKADLIKRIKIKNEDVDIVRFFSMLWRLTEKEVYFETAKKVVNDFPILSNLKDDQRVRSRMQAYAFYYDLCYEKLDFEEKKFIEEAVVKSVDWLRKKSYLTNANFSGGHEHYAHISSLIGLLAIYDGDKGSYREIARLSGRMKNKFQRFYRELAKDDGSFHMGWEYSRYYIFNQLEFMSFWKNATGEDLFVSNKWINKTADFLIYGLRPDLTYWGTGDNHSRYPYWLDAAIFRKIARQYENKNSQHYSYLIEKNRMRGDQPGELFYKFIWEILPQENSELNIPLVKEFGRAGVFSFEESGDDLGVRTIFKNTPYYFHNHAHRDANSFSIWYKKDLAIDSGYYDYYGSEHWNNYYIRTIAHNSTLIHDSNERFMFRLRPLSNDGGQRFVDSLGSGPKNVEELQSEKYQIGKNQFINEKGYDLVIADATKAYSSYKCESYKRYFLHLPKVDGFQHPVFVVVDDIYLKDEDHQVYYLLHSMEEPEEISDGFMINNEESYLENHIVFPEDYDVRFVGGEGNEFTGLEYNNPVQSKDLKEIKKWAGSWRTEVLPRHQGKHIVLMNVLVIHDGENQTKINRIPKGINLGNWNITFTDHLSIIPH